MANYTGANCPVCKKRFTESDDIVVCPICGAPHHRTCYQELGHCALDDLHIKGHTWEPGPDERKEQAAAGGQAQAAKCPACGADNPTSGLFCQICGAPLKAGSASQSPSGYQPRRYYQDPRAAASNAYAAAFAGISPEEEIEGISARDIALFVGDNSRYFLPRFKHYSERGGLLPNLAAFFFNFLYFFYRKMYLMGSILLGIFLVAQLPIFFALPEYMQYIFANLDIILKGINPVPFTPTINLWAYVLIPYMRFLLFGSGLVVSLFGNRFYMNHVLKSVRRIKALYTAESGETDDAKYAAALARRGRTSRLAAALCAAGVFLLFFAASNIMASFIMLKMQ